MSFTNAMNGCELDDSEDIILSKKDGVVNLLNERNLLNYGAIITENDVAYVMDMDRKKCTDEQWAFAKLQLREIVKSQGFYITAKGRENDLYILLRHEMAVYNDAKNKAAYRNMRQRTRALNMIDHSLLSDEHQKKLEFEIFRNAAIQIEMSENLRKRCKLKD